MSAPASSEPPAGTAARPLTPADLPTLEALVAEAGWNQTGADWQMLLQLGSGIGLFDPGRALVATAAALPHGGKIAWIGMVLVTAAWRRRGLARWLMARLLGDVGRAGLRPMLDATPAGEPTYAALGFLAGPHITRWRRDGATVAYRARAEAAIDLDLDRTAFGVDRSALLAAMQALPGSGLFADTSGFALHRPGRIATQIGPVVATDMQVGLALLAEASDRLAGPLFVDAPDVPSVTDWLERAGFTAQRPFRRMALGVVPAIAPQIIAIAGPELG